MEKFFSPFNGLDKNKNRWIETLKKKGKNQHTQPVIKNINSVFHMILVHKGAQFDSVYFHCQRVWDERSTLPVFPIICSLQWVLSNQLELYSPPCKFR